MSLPGGIKIKKAQIAGRVVYWKRHSLRNGSSFGGLFGVLVYGIRGTPYSECTWLIAIIYSSWYYTV